MLGNSAVPVPVSAAVPSMSTEDLTQLAEAEVARLQSMIAAQQQISIVHTLAFENVSSGPEPEP